MPLFVDGEPTQEEWEVIQEHRSFQEVDPSLKGSQRKTKYLQVRITPEFLAILKAEAEVAEWSLSEYIHHILVYRKRTRIAIPIQGGRYLGY